VRVTAAAEQTATDLQKVQLDVLPAGWRLYPPET
jgi:hypothetical protein